MIQESRKDHQTPIELLSEPTTDTAALTRRAFLRAGLVLTTGGLLAACTPAPEQGTPTPAEHNTGTDKDTKTG